jgi:hypothetical protein
MDKKGREVSRVHSTRLKGKGRIRSVKKLHPQYVVGFIDGEGSFNVSLYRDDKMKNKIFVRPEFSIELRADDKEILERIRETIGCGKIYDCKYKRYGWYPHVKYKVSRLEEISKILIPFWRNGHFKQRRQRYFTISSKSLERE